MEALAGHLPQPADLLQRANPPALEGIVAKPLADSLRPAQRNQFGGVGPCAFLDPRGQLVLKELVRLETIIHCYEAQLAAGCKRIPRCTYDGGAFGRQVDKNEQITEDLNHFTVKGAAAAVAWAGDETTRSNPRWLYRSAADGCAMPVRIPAFRQAGAPWGCHHITAGEASLLQKSSQHTCDGPTAGRLLWSMYRWGSSCDAWSGTGWWVSGHADHPDLAAS
jgi:hypothetical protein